MSANSFGTHFKMTSFGESHGKALGVVVEGCPSLVKWNQDLLESNLLKRAPGQSDFVTSRKEPDQVEVLSGVFQGKTLGTPIAMVVRNAQQRSQDYDEIKNNPRVGHADDLWKKKFDHYDYRGGGRASGRETISRVMAGSVAQMMVSQITPHIQMTIYPKKIHNLSFNSFNEYESSQELKELLIQSKEEGESLGGIVKIKIQNLPQALGQPVFHKLKSDFSSALLSIGSTLGIQWGEGFDAALKKGSQFHDDFDSLNYGGQRGGLSTGESFSFELAFKPPSSIKDVAKKGRHDPCVIPRALPVIESMCWLVIADHILWQRLDRLKF